MLDINSEDLRYIFLSYEKCQIDVDAKYLGCIC